MPGDDSDVEIVHIDATCPAGHVSRSALEALEARRLHDRTLCEVARVDEWERAEIAEAKAKAANERAAAATSPLADWLRHWGLATGLAVGFVGGFAAAYAAISAAAHH